MPNTLTITVSAEIYGTVPARLQVMMDNEQLGGFDIVADHAKGATQTISLTGDWPPGVAHAVGCRLTNYAGNGRSGRNVYVQTVTLDAVSKTGGTLTKSAWNKIEFPIVAGSIIASAAPVVKHDVLIGGFAGFTDLSLANCAGLIATGRGGLYLHNSAVTADPVNDAAVRAVITTMVPALGGGLDDEAGTNTFFDTGDQWDSDVAPAGVEPGTGILNCGTADEIADGSEVASTKTWIDHAKGKFPGITIAIVVTPGGDDAHLGDDFATSTHWANLRMMDVYGGRACDDVPAANWVQTPWSNYVLGHARWALAQGLPYDLILSPSDGTTFLADVKTVMAALAAAGVNPTRIIIENYTPGVGATVGMESDPNTLNAAALWVAQNKPAT